MRKDPVPGRNCCAGTAQTDTAQTFAAGYIGFQPRIFSCRFEAACRGQSGVKQPMQNPGNQCGARHSIRNRMNRQNPHGIDTMSDTAFRTHPEGQHGQASAKSRYRSNTANRSVTPKKPHPGNMKQHDFTGKDATDMKFIRNHLAIALAVCLLFLGSCGSGRTEFSPEIQTNARANAEPSESAIPPDAYREFVLAERSVSRKGEISSATATGLELRIVWQLDKKSGETGITLTVDFLLDYRAPFETAETQTLTTRIGDSEEQIPVPRISAADGLDHTLRLAERSVRYEVKNADSLREPITVNASFDYQGNYSTTDWYGKSVSVRIDSLETVARIPIWEDYENVPRAKKLDVENILQIPELPNGCEITSLTILMNYLGFSVDKLTMADQYLPKNEDTYTSDFYETFAGNPRNRWASFGCYAPVIVKSAENYLSAQNKSDAFVPQNLTGSAPEELYRQISLGNPVVLWMTQYIDKTPAILKTWTAYNGKAMNWKHPLHCVVLIGYDLDAQTVTIADPMVGIVSHSMSLFELRYLQLGSQAVIVTPR